MGLQGLGELVSGLAGSLAHDPAELGMGLLGLKGEAARGILIVPSVALRLVALKGKPGRASLGVLVGVVWAGGAVKAKVAAGPEEDGLECSLLLGRCAGGQGRVKVGKERLCAEELLPGSLAMGLPDRVYRGGPRSAGSIG